MNDPNDGTWTYEYDCGGNILNKKQYAYTTGTLGTVQQIVSYAYGDADWKDKLTRYNGVDIAYDAIGNPIHDGVWTYTWENGRQLRRMACDATIAEFVYNADGLRVQKTVNGVTTNYTLHGKNIVHMTKGNAELHFWYDAQNRPAIVEFNGTKYGYLYNLQGDVIGLIDSANTEVVKYTYDAWGKPLSVTGSLANTIGYYNPFRYRGYVYDVETGLYYLRSRYYNPSWGRFISDDRYFIIESNVGNLNQFRYCLNAPIMFVDDDGQVSFIPNNMVPPASSGYIPPKGGPVLSGPSNNKGWLDKWGNRWVPDRFHKDHWDVERGDGRGYTNVYPDGFRREGKGEPAKLPPLPQTTLTPMPSVTPNVTARPTPAPGPAPIVCPALENEESAYSISIDWEMVAKSTMALAFLLLIPFTGGASLYFAY